MKKLILIILTILLVVSCRSKKSVSEESNRQEENSSTRAEKVIDTIYRDRVVEKVKPVYSEIIIEKPCDSLGNIIPVNYNIGSGGNFSRVYSKDGKLFINQKIDSVENVLEKEYRARWEKDSLALSNSLISEQTKMTRVKVYVYPWWLWMAIIAGSLFAVLWAVEKFDLVTRVRKIIFKI